MAGQLDGKVAIITGAARGQGRCHAELFAAEGAFVFVADVSEHLATEAVGRIRQNGGRAQYIHLDVRSPEAWQVAVSTIEKQFGAIDVLVNNAGIAMRKPMVETSDDDWQETVAVNQSGVFLGMRHCIPAMTRIQGGSIVNISSVWGLAGAPERAAYQASKFAVVGLTKGAAREYGRARIRVNAVCPGFINTEMSAQVPPAEVASWMTRIPLGRGAEAIEVSRVVLFLASDQASYITGACIPVDGGWIA